MFPEIDGTVTTGAVSKNWVTASGLASTQSSGGSIRASMPACSARTHRRLTLRVLLGRPRVKLEPDDRVVADYPRIVPWLDHV